jgi:tetratricopeptide (TPR) repeat protein
VSRVPDEVAAERHLRAGQAALDAGDVDGAQACIRRVYDLAPRDFDHAADLTHLVGRLALARGQEEEAEKLFRIELELRADELRQTLRAVRAGAASVYDVGDALQDAEVWVPHTGAEGDTEVTLAMHDGETIPLFSSAETLEAAMGPGHAHLQVPFSRLLAGWPEGIDAVMDPGSDWSLRLPAHTLGSLDLS